jgi:hypothetical protein
MSAKLILDALTCADGRANGMVEIFNKTKLNCKLKSIPDIVCCY